MTICPDCQAEHLIPDPSPPYGLLLCPRHRALRADQGSMWVTKSQGNSIAELLAAAGASSDSLPDGGLATELLLTGNALTKRDLGRVRDAVQWARNAANPPAWPVRGKA